MSVSRRLGWGAAVVAVVAAGLLVASSAGAAPRTTTNHTLTLIGPDLHTLA